MPVQYHLSTYPFTHLFTHKDSDMKQKLFLAKKTLLLTIVALLGAQVSVANATSGYLYCTTSGNKYAGNVEFAIGNGYVGARAISVKGYTVKAIVMHKQTGNRVALAYATNGHISDYMQEPMWSISGSRKGDKDKDSDFIIFCNSAKN